MCNGIDASVVVVVFVTKRYVAKVCGELFLQQKCEFR